MRGCTHPIAPRLHPHLLETVVVAVVGVVTVVEAATVMVEIAVAATRAGAEVTGVVAAGGVGVLEVAVMVAVVEVATVVEEVLLLELVCVSDTLFSGRASEMRERSLRSFSVKRELRRITGCDNMFMSCPSGEASRLYGEDSPSLPVLTGTDFTEFLPFRLTFMLSSFTSKSQKSVQMPLPVACEEHGLQACLLPLSRSLSQFVSLVRCCVKWLGNTCREQKNKLGLGGLHRKYVFLRRNNNWFLGSPLLWTALVTQATCHTVLSN